MSTEPKVTIMFTLEAGEKRRLKAKLAVEGRSISDLLRECVEQYLGDEPHPTPGQEAGGAE